MYISAQLLHIKFHSALTTCIFRHQADRIQGFQVTRTFSLLYPESTFSWPSAFTASQQFFRLTINRAGKNRFGFLVHIFKLGRYRFLKEIGILGKNTVFLLGFCLTLKSGGIFGKVPPRN